MEIKRSFLSVALAILLIGCGGGSDDAEGHVDPPDAPEVSAPPIALTPAAPNDDLTPQPGSITTTSSAPTVFCGYGVGGSRISGTVTSVSDGDTITVGDTSVRLDSIDAPELGQTYGNESKAALSDLVQGKTVTVAYAKKDRYGRVVGSVFTSDCNLVNLNQVQTGAAWYYEAYKCEVNAEMRNAYAVAQERAQDASRGLWAYTAIAPWVYRNGVDPTVPVCTTTAPSWPPPSSSPAPTPTPTPTPTTPPKPPPTTTSPSPSSCAPIWVNGYRRANGTYVRGHWRRPPGCA